MTTPPSADGTGRARTLRRWPAGRGLLLLLLAALVVVAVAAIGTAWSLGDRAVPTPTSGGWWSEEMESATSQGLTESHQVFRCEPGRIEAGIDLVNDGPVAATVTDVRVPLLDDLLGIDDRAVRTGTQMMRDPYGDLDDLVAFRTAPVGGDDWLRLVLTWEVRECPELTDGGYMVEDEVEVTYVSLGMTHTATVALVLPMALTSTPLDRLP
jgi:hypothetical protein